MEEYRAFVKFRRYVDDERYDKAFEVFRENPDLVGHIDLRAFPIFYFDIRRNVGEEEAQQFLDAGRRKLSRLEELFEADTQILECLDEF